MNGTVVHKLEFEEYRNDLVNQALVNVGKSNFLSKELGIDRGQRCTVGERPPLRELWRKPTDSPTYQQGDRFWLLSFYAILNLNLQFHCV